MHPLVPLAVAAAASAGAAALYLGDRSPRGKGVFIRSVRHCGGPDECVAFAKRLGFEWVAILLVWQWNNKRSTNYLNTTLVETAKAFRRAGIKVWLWGWPAPGKTQEIVDLYGAAKAAGVRPSGFILDPEGPYYGRRHEPHANETMEMLEAMKVPLGVTTYGGGPPMHPSFAWDIWSRSDFGIPQIYDSHHTLKRSYPADSMRWWREAGWKRLIPAWGASNRHTPEQMRDMIRRTPQDYKAATWWDLYWLMLSRKRSRVVEEMRVPTFPRRMAKVA